MSRSVLVVEDSAHIRLLAELALRRQGWEVRCATSGEDGLRSFLRRQPDLVVLEVGLPDLDGWQVLASVRCVSDLPVVMITAVVRESDQARCMRSGADAYVAPPFDEDDLVGKVRALLGDR